MHPPQDPRELIAVVVVNWNGADDTLACLQSLACSTLPCSPIVVDNGSVDESAAVIAASRLAAEMIETGRNLGFAAGNNVGIRRALDLGASHIVVLNNDTVVEPDSLNVLIDHLRRSPADAVSPDIRYLEAPDVAWFAGGIVDHGWPRHLQPHELAALPDLAVRQTELITGCCVAATAEIWQRVGLFDEDYFLIFEDSDWSLRARRQGIQLKVVSGSIVHHRVSSSFSAEHVSLLGMYYYVRNGLRFEWTYTRKWLLRFAWRWLVRPAPSLLVRDRSQLLFRYLGLLGFLLGQRGRATVRTERLARSATSRGAHSGR